MQQTETLGSGTPSFERAPGSPVVPPEIAPSEDLTELTRLLTGAGPFPFDDAPGYDDVFDALARVLHRAQAHHALLIAERGVGVHAIVAEFARQAAFGENSKGSGVAEFGMAAIRSW